MSNPPDRILSVFNNQFFISDEYIKNSGAVATSNATLTTFKGEMDINENLEFTNPNYLDRFIVNLHKMILCNNNLLTNSFILSAMNNTVLFDQSGSVSGSHIFSNLDASSVKTTTLSLSTAVNVLTATTNSIVGTTLNVNCDNIKSNKATVNLLNTTPTTINFGSASSDIVVGGTLNGENLSYISGLTENIQTALDSNTSDIANDCVRKSGGTQIITGPSLTTAGGRLSVYHGDIASAVSSVPLLVSNSNLSDATVNGTLSGEVVYPMIQMGNRACVFANGTDNTNMYMGTAGGGGNDCDYEYTYRREVGMKISPTFDTNTFTEALKVVGTVNVTGAMTVGGLLNGNNMTYQDATSSVQTQIDTNATNIANRIQLSGGTMTGGLVINASSVIGETSADACTIIASIHAGAPNSYLRNLAGIHLLSGTAGSYYFTPIFHSTTNILTNTYEQQYTSGTTGYTSQDGTALGSWSNIDINNSQDKFLVFPNFGLKVYNDSLYTNIIMNFKNTTNGPIIAKCTTDNTATSIRVFYDDLQVEGL